MRTLSADDYQYWAVDFVRSEYTVIMANGQHITGSVPAVSGRLPQVALSVFDWERWWVFSTTIRCDYLVSEAYSPIHTDKGRPAVYLDQNHWSTLAWARVDSRRVADKDELAAALRIIELASDAGIVLPLSSAHLTETGPLYGDRRYNLGLAMAQPGEMKVRYIHIEALPDGRVRVHELLLNREALDLGPYDPRRSQEG